MATRSRRSAAGSESLNPAMIHLLDAGRLRKELERRGLDTSGNKNILADRLQEAVDLERIGCHAYSSPPPPERSPRKATKRTSAVKKETDEAAGGSSPNVPEPKRKRTSAPAVVEEVDIVEESFSIEFSNEGEAGVSFIQEQAQSDNDSNVELMAVKKGNTKNELKEVTAKENGAIEGKDQQRKAPSTSEVASKSKRAPSQQQQRKSSAKRTAESQQSEAISLQEKSAVTPRSPEIKIKIRATEEGKLKAEVTDSETNLTIEDVDTSSTKKAVVKEVEEKFERKEKTTKKSEKVQKTSDVGSAVEKTSTAKTSTNTAVTKAKDVPVKPMKSLKVKYKADTVKEETPPKQSHSKPHLRKSEEPPLHPTNAQKKNEEDKGKVAAANAELKKKSVEHEPNAAKEAVATVEAEKKKDTVVRKKIPLRMQAPIDVLDSIIDKQKQLLSSKYKTEEEKSAERQKIEMAKRRQSGVPAAAVPLPPVEKRRHTVEFALPPPIHRNYVQQHRHSPITLPPPPAPRASILKPDPYLSEERLLARLPAPPPPPILSPVESTPVTVATDAVVCSPALSSTSSSTYHSSVYDGSDIPGTSALGSNIVSPPTPPSVPPYSSPPEGVNSPPAPQPFDFSADRLKEVANALQAVFARIGDPGSTSDVVSNVIPEDAEHREAENVSSVTGAVFNPAVTHADAICGSATDSVAEATVPFTVTSTSEVSNGFSGNSSEVLPHATVVESYCSSAEVIEETHKTEDEVTFSVASNDPDTAVIKETVMELTAAVAAVLVSSAEDAFESGTEEPMIATKNIADKEAAHSISSDTPVGTSTIAENSAHLDDGTTSSEPSEDSSSHEAMKDDPHEKKPAISEELLRDPRLLLQKASDVLKSLNTQEAPTEEPPRQYVQISPDPDYEVESEEKPLPEFHGEPVPDSDDEVIIEGIRRKGSAKKGAVQEEEPIPGDEHIEIDFYNADLHIKASEKDPTIIDPDNGDGFALMWGGVRSTYGICIPSDLDDFPKVAFQAKIIENIPVKHIPFEELEPHDVRVGWSLQNTSNILGESPWSYAYGSLAQKAVNSIFTDYGEPFGVKDIITAIIDLKKGEICYFKNEQRLGVAFQNLHFAADDVIFPHICTKNCKVAINFGEGRAEEWLSLEKLQCDKEEEDDERLIFISDLERKFLFRGPTPPSSKGECTVLMMVGLPGVGKTTWVRQYLRDHPHEQWTLLNTDTILSAMKVNGVARSRVHQGRWDMVMGLTAKALNRSLHLACRRRRNYIIDQTNVSKDGRRRKLSQFKDFQRKCVVIIPSEEEMLSRQLRQSRADGVGPIPVEAMLELKAMFSIPNVETEPIEDVYFVEPPLERIGEAIELVNRFNEEARPWCQKKRGRRGSSDRGGGGNNDFARSNDNRQNNNFSNRRVSAESAPPVVNCDCRGETPQASAQPSPIVSSFGRPNEGYCGFGGVVPPSLLPAVPMMDPSVRPPVMDLTVPPPILNPAVPPPIMDPSVPPPTICTATSWAEHKNSVV